FSGPVIVVGPGICIREVVQVRTVEIPIQFAPIQVPCCVGVVATVRMVAAIIVIGMDSTYVTSMPGRVSDKRGAVEIYRPAGPVSSPRVPPPAGAGQGTQRYSGTK